MSGAATLPGRAHVEELMGMVIGIDIRDADLPLPAVDAAIDRAFAWLHHVDATFSTYREDSEVSRLTRGELAPADASYDVRWVLERCAALTAETRGYFDARAGGALDPSGLVKGWSVDRASALLADVGATNHCINAGGDVRVRGVPEPGREWQVGVVHPHNRQALTTLLRLDGWAAVATSGTAERGFHVIDPHTHRPATALSSVTVVGAELADADAYATAALAMGLDAPDWLSTLSGFESLVIDSAGYQWATPGFDDLRVL